MTIPYERYLSVKNTRQFLLELLNPKLTPRVPKVIRRQAYWLLRHYPYSFELDQVCKLAPSYFTKNAQNSSYKPKKRSKK